MPPLLQDHKTNPHILVVDDEPEIRKVLVGIFRKKTEYQVDEASDGIDALKKQQEVAQSESPYDLMVVDLKMPRMDGETLIQEVRKTDQDVAIVVMTGHGDLMGAFSLLENYQISDYLYKPMEHYKVLLFSVRNALEKRRLKQQLQTSNKQLEQRVRERTEELKTAKEQAEAANHAKTKFLNNMSHELRNPLHAIVGFSQNLLNKTKSSPIPSDELGQQLNNIHVCSQALTEQINNVLDFSKIEAGKMEVLEEDFNLADLVTNLFDIYDFQAQQKGVILSYEIAPNLPQAIHCDRIKLTQILTNLLGNAIKFTPADKEVKFLVRGNEQVIAFIIIDQGIGFSKERQEAIFDEFEQADSAIPLQFGGTGLGLAISKKLTEIMGGEIYGISLGVGLGSNFSVRLPYKAASITQEAQEPALEAPKFSKDNAILVIEDNLMNQDLITILLKNFGLDPVFANDGKEGVEKTLEMIATGHPPDLILMDLKMPVMDGFESTKQIYQYPECQNIPIVALSAEAFLEQKKQASEIGMRDYLVKPLSINRLKQVLNKYLH